MLYITVAEIFLYKQYSFAILPLCLNHSEHVACAYWMAQVKPPEKHDAFDHAMCRDLCLRANRH